MTPEEVIALFRETGALLEGHFLYTSGRHGAQFLQASRVLQHPGHATRLCSSLAGQFADDAIDLVVGPAVGGIILAYETARHLECRAGFTEKGGPEGMALKRGLALRSGTRVLVVEDIITTGGSVKKTVEHLRRRGAEVVGVSALIDRSGGEATFDCRYAPLARLTMESWEPEDCPLCARATALIDPDELSG